MLDYEPSGKKNYGLPMRHFKLSDWRLDEFGLRNHPHHVYLYHYSPYLYHDNPHHVNPYLYHVNPYHVNPYFYHVNPYY